MMAGIATFDQLVASGGKRRFDTVTLPVCGLTFRIRSLCERELSEYYAVLYSGRDEKQKHQRLAASNRQFIALCLVDEDGNRIVSPDDVAKLADMDGADAGHLYTECLRHTGAKDQDIQDIVGNSEETMPSDSPTS